ncbi:yip1d-interacting factor 1 [Megalopta genalis]|uniref:yip1d-interacting factor 1 n=1 Tax=Megalopta genalis TaxID=115081 RepID=UPI001442F1BF|nr:protein YIF1B [Megalopta genalis]
MNYNHSSARRGRPKRILDPSAGLSTPTSIPQNPYMYNQQVPMNNGMMPEYGFNIPQQQASSYGFRSVPMQTYPSTETMPPSEQYSTPQFTTQLLAEPVVTNVAMQYGNALMGYGSQTFEKYVPVTALKYYFAVDTNYVLTKLSLLLFPFSQKDWSVRYEQDIPLQPRFEKNALDMYIPTMAFVTYIVIAALVLGIQDRFTPLSTLASSALAWNIVEIVVQLISLYVMHLETSLSTLDLLAYCGYKYVGINAALLASLVFRTFGYYMTLLYCSISLAFFVTRSLKLRVLPRNDSSYTASGNKRRIYFIFFVAGAQPVLMWCLSHSMI